MLGHTVEHTMTDSERTPKDIREVEAESVAYFSARFSGCRGWKNLAATFKTGLSGQEIAEKSAQRIFKTADAILKAGA